MNSHELLASDLSTPIHCLHASLDPGTPSLVATLVLRGNEIREFDSVGHGELSDFLLDGEQ